jgi:hypothetical protein
MFLLIVKCNRLFWETCWTNLLRKYYRKGSQITENTSDVTCTADMNKTYQNVLPGNREHLGCYPTVAYHQRQPPFWLFSVVWLYWNEPQFIPLWSNMLKAYPTPWSPFSRRNVLFFNRQRFRRPAPTTDICIHWRRVEYPLRRTWPEFREVEVLVS